MPNPLFLPGETIAAAKLQQLGNEGIFTPTLTAVTTNPTLGTSPTQTALVWLNGQMVNIWFTIIFGTGMTAGSGAYQVPLPTAYPIIAGAYNTGVGTGRVYDSSGATGRITSLQIDPATQKIIMYDSTNGNAITNAAPWTFAANDEVHGHVAYITDFGI